MKMTGHSSKYLLAYYLADQLDAARKYSREEIEEFIACQVDPTTYDDPTMALDHIRMAMVDNKFVIRDSHGRRYWVSDFFVKPSDPVEKNFEKLTRRQSSVAGKKFYICGHCGQQFKGIRLARHFVRHHTYSRQMEKIEKYLLEGIRERKVCVK
jgi:hypothetical protein